MYKIFAVLLSLPLLAQQCEKKQTTCLKGKVVRVTCATTVVQVLNNSSVGDAAWSDSMVTHQTYKHVFSVTNKCEMPATLKAGDEFWFSLDSSHTASCIVCMMYDAPPRAQFAVKNFSTLPCAVQ